MTSIIKCEMKLLIHSQASAVAYEIPPVTAIVWSQYYIAYPVVYDKPHVIFVQILWTNRKYIAPWIHDFMSIIMIDAIT